MRFDTRATRDRPVITARRGTAPPTGGQRITFVWGVRLRRPWLIRGAPGRGGAVRGLAIRPAQSVAADGSCRNTVSVTLLRQRSAGRR